jgi:hypothetical protein
MVDRYAKFATKDFAVAAARIESGRGGNVVRFYTSSLRTELKRP